MGIKEIDKWKNTFIVQKSYFIQTKADGASSAFPLSNWL